MKTSIDKSKVMRRAWNIFRSKSSPYSYSFAESLRRAWHVEKAEIAYVAKLAQQAIEKAERAAWNAERRNNPVSESFLAGCAAEYAAGSNGRKYFGD